MISDISITLPLIRFQRQFSPRILDQKVSYVDSFEEAIRYFNKTTIVHY